MKILTHSQKLICDVLRKEPKMITLDNLIQKGFFKRSLQFLTDLYDLEQQEVIVIKTIKINNKIDKYIKLKRK